MIDENIKFEFRLLTIGVTNVGNFTDVVCEIRYNLFALLDLEERERYYVHTLDTSNLCQETFHDIKDVTQEQIIRWLEESIDPQNLIQMKKSMHELFYPQIKYILPGLFKKESGS